MQRLTTGIPVPDVILEELKQEGETFGISDMFIQISPKTKRR
jgi:hypothetical protein